MCAKGVAGPGRSRMCLMGVWQTLIWQVPPKQFQLITHFLQSTSELRDADRAPTEEITIIGKDIMFELQRLHACCV